MADTPIGQRPRAFLDTETTGLDPVLNEVIEIAIIRETPDGTFLDEWATKVKPQHIETAHPKALAVNGYTEEARADAPLFEEVADTVVRRLNGCVIVGHNPKFDLLFLEEALKKAGMPYARLPYHAIDTVTLVYEHLVPQGLGSLSLDRVRDFLGWSREGAHGALKDTQDCRKLYHQLTMP